MSSPILDDDHPHPGRLLPTSRGAPLTAWSSTKPLTRCIAPAETLRAQLLHLHHLAQQDHITVHLIPADTGPHPGCAAHSDPVLLPAHTPAYTPHPAAPATSTTNRPPSGLHRPFATLKAWPCPPKNPCTASPSWPHA